MDSTAVNYDPLADTDDGSCILACQTAPYCENFDAGVPADWTNNGWLLNSYATGSSGTGPSDDITGGGNYMYYETSGLAAGTPAITLTSLCLDISGLTTPTLSFYNHMLGATMGTLDVLVNGTNVWSQSGDQGDVWNFAQVDLSTYAGSTNITIDFVGNYGTSFTGDMAIDEVCVDEYLVIDGCTDPTALNYDPNANNDDGSCNYCTLDNVTLNLYDSFGDGWNGGIMTVNGVDYTVSSGSLASFDLCVDLTTCTDLIYTAGSWSTENSWDVVDASGAVIAAGPNASGTIGAGCPVYGCTDTTAANYDPAADTDDGSCDYLGCTNPTATNYDATATIDDGSCVFGCTLDEVTLVLTDSWGDGWNGNSLTIDGVNYTIISGATESFTNICIDLTGCTDVIYNATGTYTYENSWEIVDASGAVIASGGDASGNVGSGCPVYGCTDPAATNYDASANTDDGTCSYSGCTDPAATNYNANATTDDGSCVYPCLDNAVTSAATDSWASENSFDITDCDGNVITSGVPGYDNCIVLPANYSVNLYDSYGDGGGSVTIDGTTYTLLAGSSESFQVGVCTVNGCTDSTANNYDASANTDDGTCTYDVFGCTDATQFNYDATATVDDGSCQPFTYGCTDASASNYNSTVNTDDGSCIWLGCTDAAADNYDAIATIDDGTCTYTVVDGCTDPAADNYDATATNDDGSCTYAPPVVCNEDSPTGLFVDGIIHSRAVINWDNMNSSTCTVDQYRIRFREVGTSSWTQKTMGGPIGSCTWGNQRIDKLLLGLTGNTTYEYEMKAWYCGGGASSWTGLSTFTTADNCPNVGNLTAVGANPTKATFTWDASNGSYEFVRLKARVDSISNPTGSDWFQIGGSGVAYGTYTKDKNGLVAGETYRGQARAFCDPNGGAYFSLSWTPLVYWTQPVVRVEGGTAIANLDVYPNPSRDLFNVTFTSEDVQDLEVRVINVVGEVVYTENLQQFVGEYTKSIDLETYTKGVYFLEITTNNGVVNKKLILQ
jgi:hypothetical protein